MTSCNQSDETADLVGQLLADDKVNDAWRAVTSAYYNSLVSYVRVRFASVSSPDEFAHDTVGEFLLGVRDSLATYRGDGSLRGWLFKGAHRAAVRRLTRGPAVRETQIESDAWRQMRAQVDVLRTTAIHVRALADRFSRFYEGLTDEEQLLLYLRDHQGFSWNEIAEIEGSADATETTTRVNTLTQRHRRLRKRFARWAQDQELMDSTGKLLPE